MKYLVPVASMKYFLIFLFAPLLFISACKDDEGETRINIFTLEDDKSLGAELNEEIQSNPEDYPILDREDYPEPYEHFDRITNTVLSSGKVRYEDELNWSFYLIDEDVLNAFAAPGGYIYVYTGLIRFLESEDELAGVIGHEIAHADRRHSTERLTRAYGVSLLFDIILGEDRSMIADIAAQLAFLSYSRSQESEADEYSVVYLYPTEYDARGAARFFEKLIEEGDGGSAPEFFSSHPSPDNRVEEIIEKWEELGGEPGGRFEDRYADFISSLP